MRIRPPAMQDRAQFSLYMPWKYTLYGSMALPMQWLRIVSSGYDGKILTTSIQRRQYSNGSGGYTDIVTTMGTSNFLEYVSYGSTCHIEPLVTPDDSLNGFVDLSSSEGMDGIMTQALLRGYESRVNILLDIAEKKRRSIMRDENNTNALVYELYGCCVLWKQLMDFGRITPIDCVRMNQLLGKTDSIAAAIDKAKAYRDSLQIRLYDNDFNENLRLSLNDSERKALLSAYGVD